MHISKRFLIILLVVLLAACGGDDSKDSADSAPEGHVVWQHLATFEESGGQAAFFGGFVELSVSGDTIYLAGDDNDPALVRTFDFDGNPGEDIMLDLSSMEGSSMGPLLADVTVDEDGTFWALVSRPANIAPIYHFAADGSELASFGEFGGDEGQIASGIELRIGSDGNLYILEKTDPVQISIWSKDGTFVREFPVEIRSGAHPAFWLTADNQLYVYSPNDIFTAGYQVYDNEGNAQGDPVMVEQADSSATTASRVIFDAEGNITLTSASYVATYNAAGELQAVFGEREGGPTSEAPIEAGQFNRPYDLAALPDGSVVVVDNNRAYWQLVRVSFNGE